MRGSRLVLENSFIEDIVTQSQEIYLFGLMLYAWYPGGVSGLDRSPDFGDTTS